MSRRFVLATSLAVVLVGMLTLAFDIQPIRASGTIYIRADGSVEGTDKIQRDGDIYTFTDNIYDEIVVERDNIIVDGVWHVLQGIGSNTGLDLSGRTNVTVKDMRIMNFTYGLWLDYSTNCLITRNNITANYNRGIGLYYSSNNSIYASNITNNGHGIYLYGYGSSDNTVSGNTITNNGHGISLYYGSKWNSISENIIANNGRGIMMDLSEYNTISGNNVTGNTSNDPYIAGAGLYLSRCADNIIYGNNITNNECGAYLDDAYSFFYHNNFVNNTRHVHYWGVVENVWDNGYLSGGNYWDDYEGVDEKSGPYQDHPGSDGIGDIPYGEDRYPLMNPWTPTQPTSHIIRVPIDLPTILEAMDVAGIGYTIFVYNGTYYERLAIRKPLLLIGENPATTILDGGGEGTVVNVRANNVVIQNFTIRNSGSDSDAGISIENDGAGPFYGHALISHNTITDNVWGITLYYSSYNIVMENNIANNTNGIIFYCSSNNTISRNNITRNQQNGVQFSESRNNSISGNNIGNNGNFGLGFFTTSSNNIIYGNNLVENGYGIYIKQASHNKFYHNNFTNNTNQAHIEPTQFVEYVSENTLDDGYPSGGNYWSDYAGADSDHDGIGDTPYVIDENNQDNYPLMYLGGTPTPAEEDVPFWMQWWFSGIVAVGIVALAGAIYFVKKRKPPTPTAPTAPMEDSISSKLKLRLQAY